MNDQAAERMFRVRSIYKPDSADMGLRDNSRGHLLRDIFTAAAYAVSNAFLGVNADKSDKRVIAAVDRDMPYTAWRASRTSSLPEESKFIFRIASNQLLNIKFDEIPDPGAEQAYRRKMQEITDILRVKQGVPAFFKQEM